MMTSSGLRRAARSASELSTTAAGIISQMARGDARLSTKSSSDEEAMAPSLASACTASAFLSKTTHWWPLRNRRRTMLAPIRPRPIIPSCMICFPFFPGIARRRLPEGLLNGGSESCKTCLDILAEMHAQDAAVAFGKHLEVASRLCGFDNAEGVFLPRHRDVGLVVASDLQEDAAVRPALVCLSCRMQEARAEAETGRHALAGAN